MRNSGKSVTSDRFCMHLTFGFGNPTGLSNFLGIGRGDKGPEVGVLNVLAKARVLLLDLGAAELGRSSARRDCARARAQLLHVACHGGDGDHRFMGQEKRHNPEHCNNVSALHFPIS
ncbi:hypothetical protein U1Q18_043767 [Sarracenia purpurea var. burkii]